MKAEVYEDRSREWRWKLKAQNGRVMAQCGDAYGYRWEARRALKQLLMLLDKRPRKITWIGVD